MTNASGFLPPAPTLSHSAPIAIPRGRARAHQVGHQGDEERCQCRHVPACLLGIHRPSPAGGCPQSRTRTRDGPTLWTTASPGGERGRDPSRVTRAPTCEDANGPNRAATLKQVTLGRRTNPRDRRRHRAEPCPTRSTRPAGGWGQLRAASRPHSSCTPAARECPVRVSGGHWTGHSLARCSANTRTAFAVGCYSGIAESTPAKSRSVNSLSAIQRRSRSARAKPRHGVRHGH